MARLDEFPEAYRKHLLKVACPKFDETPFVRGPRLAQRRVAIISSAGLYVRGDRPFTSIASDYRIVPGDVTANDLLMSHISVNYDRSGFQQDWNVVFPIDRLRELAERGQIGSVADFHYSFMGAVGPEQLESSAGELAELLRRDGVTAALLIPV